MKDGSVIVDLAAEQGGNCELTEPEKWSISNGVTIIGYTDLPSRLAAQSSQLYATNLRHLLTDMTPEKDGRSSSTLKTRSFAAQPFARMARQPGRHRRRNCRRHRRKREARAGTGRRGRKRSVCGPIIGMVIAGWRCWDWVPSHRRRSWRTSPYSCWPALLATW